MPNNKYMLWTEDETLVFKQYVMNQHLNCVQACKCSNPEVPVIVRLIRNYPVPSLAGGHLVLNQLSIGNGSFWINSLSHNPNPGKEAFWKHFGKRENPGNQHFLLCPQCFLSFLNPFPHNDTF